MKNHDFSIFLYPIDKNADLHFSFFSSTTEKKERKECRKTEVN